MVNDVGLRVAFLFPAFFILMMTLVQQCPIILIRCLKFPSQSTFVRLHWFFHFFQFLRLVLRLRVFFGFVFWFCSAFLVFLFQLTLFFSLFQSTLLFFVPISPVFRPPIVPWKYANKFWGRSDGRPIPPKRWTGKYVWDDRTIHAEPEQTGIEFRNFQKIIDEWRAELCWNPTK